MWIFGITRDLFIEDFEKQKTEIAKFIDEQICAYEEQLTKQITKALGGK